MTGVDGRLSDRWRTPEGARLARTVIRHLVRCKPLDRLQLGTVDGRLDLRYLSLPEPRLVDERQMAGFEVTTYAEVVELKKTQLRSLDLSFAHLPRLELTKVRLENVKLEGAHCRNWRSWSGAWGNGSGAAR